MFSIGFLVNPYAGMGGSVGLKGTDGLVDEAVRRGAVPHAGDRAAAALTHLWGLDLEWFTCSGEMGADVLIHSGIPRYTIAYTAPTRSTPADTRHACREFLRRKVDLILFCGGDGTARDVFSQVGRDVPILGIPAGVKMYSGVFAVSPAAVGGILAVIGEIPTRDAEVMDIDEEAYRNGELKTRLSGYARTPYLPSHVSGAKQVFEEQDEERAKDEIARFLGEVMAATPKTLYIVGPGTTTGRIVTRMGGEKTLLGFDALLDGEVVSHDLDEKGVLALLAEGGPARLLISPIGAQGFIFGHGTQAISPAAIRAIGLSNIIIVATPAKLRETPVLFVDTGDTALDESFGESVQVISGYHIAQRKRLLHGGDT